MQVAAATRKIDRTTGWIWANGNGAPALARVPLVRACTGVARQQFAAARPPL